MYYSNKLNIYLLMSLLIILFSIIFVFRPKIKNIKKLKRDYKISEDKVEMVKKFENKQINLLEEIEKNKKDRQKIESNMLLSKSYNDFIISINNYNNKDLLVEDIELLDLRELDEGNKSCFRIVSKGRIKDSIVFFKSIYDKYLNFIIKDIYIIKEDESYICNVEFEIIY